MRYALPKSKKSDQMDLVTAVSAITNRGLSVLNPRKVEWKINYHYLQGVRDFYIVSFRTGRVDATWESDQGQLRFRFEDILEQYNRELGQLLSLNPYPEVSARKKLHLDGARKAAAGQVYLDHVMGPLDLTNTHLALCEGLLQFGTMGLAAFTDPSVHIEDGTYVSTIPPWQLLPLPAQPTRAEDVMGLIRYRWVPYLDLLEKSKGALDFPANNAPMSRRDVDNRLEIRWSGHGGREPQVDGDPEDNDYAGFEGEPVDRDMGSRGPSASLAYGLPWVLLTEVWVCDHRGRVDRNIVMLGKWVAKDVSFEYDVSKPYCPIGIARGDHAGGFYARPWMSKLVPFNNESERMFSNLFKNVQEFDQFGHLFLPANVGIKREHLESKSRPQAHFYEYDYMGQPFKIERVTPVNSGELPGRVAASSVQMMDRLGKNSPMYRGDMPGRAESAASLGVLHETSAVSRKATVASIESAYRQIYKCILEKGHSSDVTGLRLETIDHLVAGLVFNDDGTLDLSKNPLPSADEVQINIKSSEPRLLTQKKQELLEMRKAGLINEEGFIWRNYKDDLGFPLDSDAEISQRELCMWRNIVSFNDGETPKQVKTSRLDMHHIHEKVLMEFMSLPVFNVASVEVQQAIEDRLIYHQTHLGRYPEGLPYPEDAAAAMPGMPGKLPPQLQKVAGNLKAQGQKAQLGQALSGAGIKLPTGQPQGPPQGGPPSGGP